MILPLNPHFGGPVTGLGFFPRTYPVQLTLNTLRDGGSPALFGPRRTGKSSILREAGRLLALECVLLIDIDLQGRSGPAAFASNILAKIPKDARTTILTSWARLGGLPANLLNVFTKGGDAVIPTDKATEALFSEYWEALSDVVQTQLLASDQTIVLLLDELPYFCEQQIERGVSPRVVDDFLATLRRWRQAGIAMAIAGSIGMRHVIRAHGLSPDHLNDLTPIPVQPLEPEEAVAMLGRLAAGAAVSWWMDAHAQAVVAEAPDLIPSYLQAAFSACRALETPSPKDVETVLRRTVRTQFVAGFFGQFDKRLDRYGEGAGKAKAVLDLLLTGPRPRADLLAALRAAGAADDYGAGEFLQEMVEDGFVGPAAEDGAYELAYRMVASWWRQRA